MPTYRTPLCPVIVDAAAYAAARLALSFPPDWFYNEDGSASIRSMLEIGLHQWKDDLPVEALQRHLAQFRMSRVEEDMGLIPFALPPHLSHEFTDADQGLAKYGLDHQKQEVAPLALLRMVEWMKRRNPLLTPLEVEDMRVGVKAMLQTLDQEVVLDTDLLRHAESVAKSAKWLVEMHKRGEVLCELCRGLGLDPGSPRKIKDCPKCNRTGGMKRTEE